MAQRSSDDTLQGDQNQGNGLWQNPRTGSDNEKRVNEENQAPGNSRPDEENNPGYNHPHPVGLFHPSLNTVWKFVLKKWATTLLILFCFILCALSLYWSVLFHIPQNFSALTVAVVNFDGQSPYEGTTPVIGRMVEQIARELAAIPRNELGYRIEAPEKYGGDPLAVRQAVYDEHHWAAIIVNANATTLLQQAVTIGNRSYSPIGAAQVIINTARDQTTYSTYIEPKLFEFETQVAARFGVQWIQTVLSNSSLDAATYSRVPQALNPAIGFSSFDLRPFGPPQATPAVTIGLIYLIIIAFFSFAFFLPVYTKFLVPKGHPPMHFWELVLFRLFMTSMAYLIMSLAYSLVSLAFLIPFSNDYPHNDVTPAKNPDAYGHGTFVVYWMLNWVGMYALGLASENVTMVIGQPWTAL